MYLTAARQDTPCPVCGGRISSAVPYPDSNRTLASLRFESIAICAECGLGVADPRPSQRDLDAYYASGAYWHASAGSKAQLAHERNQGRHRVLRCLPHFAKGGSVADVGAGHGAIAEWLDRLTSERVDQYDFIEPDATSRQGILALRTRFSIACANTAAELGDNYALLFLNHVLEHVADPFAFLADLCSRLRPGGIAYIETPHADYQFKDNVFPHTLFFTASALRHLAARLGFEVVECESFGKYPSAAGAIRPRTFRWLNAIFHLTARGAPGAVTQILDDAIWRYRPLENGMWLRSILRRPL
jgi:2-polyprenyl-3-methyl-5-hydroxy-6-metoxy-1,4-benzoquinol methylase